MISEKSLSQLLQTDSSKAWDAFLREYTDYIYTVIRKYVYRRSGEDQDTYQDRIADTYVYILEKLSEDNFKRLRSFRGDCKFTTWLTKVCQNLCFDSLRKELPLETPVPIKRLSEIHRTAFDLFYLKGCDHSECFGILATNHGFRLSYGEFLNVMDDINTALTDKNIWKFANHWRTCVMVSLDALTTEEGE